jgi:hypothetical protein
MQTPNQIYSQPIFQTNRENKAFEEDHALIGENKVA